MTDYYNELNLWLQQHTPKVITEYPVPLLGEGGTCSLFGELDDTPFNLLENINQKTVDKLALCQSICDFVAKQTDVDWFGIYISRLDNNNEPVLTKLAYFGAPSRAEFPLTEDFAQISNNSKVGLTGSKRTINDVAQYIADGGEYYTCDPKVKSELCWPIIKRNPIALSSSENILGIIDAECFAENSFDENTQQLFEAVCQVLAEHLDVTN